MSNAAARLVGEWQEWPCPQCGDVMQSRRGGGGLCGGCAGPRIAELVRALRVAEHELDLANRDNDKHCDRIYDLQQKAKAAGLSVQARNALALAKRYLAEGDDFELSERLRETVLQAIATVDEADGL